MSKQKTVPALHPTLAVPFNGVFFNTADTNSSDLQQNVGKPCRYIAPKYPGQYGDWTIVAVQKIWNGKLAYRITAEDNPFGYPAEPHEIEFIA